MSCWKWRTRLPIFVSLHVNNILYNIYFLSFTNILSESRCLKQNWLKTHIDFSCIRFKVWFWKGLRLISLRPTCGTLRALLSKSWPQNTVNAALKSRNNFYQTWSFLRKLISSFCIAENTLKLLTWCVKPFRSMKLYMQFGSCGICRSYQQLETRNIQLNLFTRRV